MTIYDANGNTQFDNSGGIGSGLVQRVSRDMAEVTEQKQDSDGIKAI